MGAVTTSDFPKLGLFTLLFPYFGAGTAPDPWNCINNLKIQSIGSQSDVVKRVTSMERAVPGSSQGREDYCR